MRRFLFALAAFSCVVLPAVLPAHAQDQAALSGLSEVKVGFDVTTGDAAALLKTLEVIDETRQSLIKQGVEPHFIVAFRGPATRLVQTDTSKIKPEDRDAAVKIADAVKALEKADGVDGIEQCAVAIRLAGTNPENVIPGIKVVGNGWISLMAYQAKGYGYIAP